MSIFVQVEMNTHTLSVSLAIGAPMGVICCEHISTSWNEHAPSVVELSSDGGISTVSLLCNFQK